MDRNTNKIGLVNLIVLLALGAASVFLARYSHSFTAQAGIIFLGLGFLVIAIGYFQMRLEETERLEKLEFEEMNKAAGSASLFNTADSEVFPAQRSREQFERFFVPAFTVVLFLLQAGSAWFLWKWLGKTVPIPLRQPTVAMSLFGLFALTLFLLGKYSIGVTRLEDARLLRPGASYLLLSAYICFVITGCIAAVVLGFPRVDVYAAYVLAGLLGLMAVETLVALVLEIYRPRVKGKAGRVLYDSRLVGLLAEPQGLFTTAAHALDYQFGFKVSETWFYRFLEKALAWLILLQVAVLLFSTSFVFIAPGEQGLLERFGKPVSDRKVLEPGLHLKMPWPIDKVHRFSTREIQSFKIGSVSGEESSQAGHGHEEGKTVLWTAKHSEEESNWLVASPTGRNPTNQAAGERGIPVDLLNVTVPVQFRIKDLQAWAYDHIDAGKTLKEIATREVVHYLARNDLLTLMSTGRGEAAEALRRNLQKKASDLNLGVEIVFVGLQDLHPPSKVAPEFQKVVAAEQENAAKLHEAKGYAAKTISVAQAEAKQTLGEMQSYSNRTVSAAIALAGPFPTQVRAYNASPRVYREYSYLQALERGLTNARKYVVATTNLQDVLQLNIEDQIRDDLLKNLAIPPAK